MMPTASRMSSWPDSAATRPVKTLGEAENRGHRRADFVAHVGEKVALRQRRRLGDGVEPLQFGLLPLQDVLVRLQILQVDVQRPGQADFKKRLVDQIPGDRFRCVREHLEHALEIPGDHRGELRGEIGRQRGQQESEHAARRTPCVWQARRRRPPERECCSTPGRNAPKRSSPCRACRNREEDCRTPRQASDPGSPRIRPRPPPRGGGGGETAAQARTPPR